MTARARQKFTPPTTCGFATIINLNRNPGASQAKSEYTLTANDGSGINYTTYEIPNI